ncbi:MAG: hypothetical protein JWR15_658 [Prosthecobacter sp.]|nr:hypothetical protein [Prosthecobacter sp.]
MSDDLPEDPKRIYVLNNARIVGAIMALVGAFFGRATIYRPICDAHEGLATISDTYKGSSLAVIFLLFGSLYLFGGRKVVETLWPPSGEGLKTKCIMGAVGLLIMLAVPALLRMYLSSFTHVP